MRIKFVYVTFPHIEIFGSTWLKSFKLLRCINKTKLKCFKLTLTMNGIEIPNAKFTLLKAEFSGLRISAVSL